MFEFAKYAEFDEDDNLFLNKTKEHQFFIQNFPLMPQIIAIENFDWKSLNDPVTYDHLLEDFEGSLNHYLNSFNDFTLTDRQIFYLKNYLDFLYEKFNFNLEQFY